jgi:glycosyltransferase involved in cell wall biosynthesis
MKNKILEAFSAGTPVVTNLAGIEGVAGAHGGRHHLEGETADALADRCAELLSDPRRSAELAREARLLVERDYTWPAQAERLLTLYAGGRPGA